MNRVFSIKVPLRVPDGTWVSPFPNVKDSQSDLPFRLLDGFSFAARTIAPKSCSKINVMPVVTQVTFVRSDNLAVEMKGPEDPETYILRLAGAGAALTEPGMFFQLLNEGSEHCEVLYVVNPACVFEMDPESGVLYDDSLVLDEDWDGLAATGRRAPQAVPTRKQREKAMRRLFESKKSGPQA